MVDAVLEETRRLQRRVRDVPARVGVYLLLAGCLFAELGYPQIWAKLTAGLGGLPVPGPAASAMTQARRRIGPRAAARAVLPAARPVPGGHALAGATGLRSRRHHHDGRRQRREPGGSPSAPQRIR